MKQESISNKELPLISIIVSCYNVFPFLNKCVVFNVIIVILNVLAI